MAEDNKSSLPNEAPSEVKVDAKAAEDKKEENKEEKPESKTAESKEAPEAQKKEESKSEEVKSKETPKPGETKKEETSKPEAAKKEETPKVEEEEKTEPKEEKAKKLSDKEFKELEKKYKDVIEKIEKMTVLELSELVKVLEDKFGVSAQAPVQAAPATQASGGGETEEEKTEFNVELTEVGPNKIQVIKVVREITEKGLKESKDLVDAAPKVINENVPKNEAEEMKKKFEEAGAKVTLK